MKNERKAREKEEERQKIIQKTEEKHDRWKRIMAGDYKGSCRDNGRAWNGCKRGLSRRILFPLMRAREPPYQNSRFCLSFVLLSVFITIHVVRIVKIPWSFSFIAIVIPYIVHPGVFYPLLITIIFFFFACPVGGRGFFAVPSRHRNLCHSRIYCFCHNP